MSLAPAVFLSSMVAGATAALLLTRAVEQQGRAAPAWGVTGRLAEHARPSPALLRQASWLAEPAAGAGAAPKIPDGPHDIPEPMLAAYRQAADTLAGTDPGCGIHWSVLASIGRIESDHARAGRVDAEGTTVTAILGPRLAGGPKIATIPDTEGGRLDGDPVWDRAVGPMQFIPTTWQEHGTDGNGDGVADPHNVHDASRTTGEYLCSGSSDLREPKALARAVFRYNQSDEYVRTVLAWAAAYARGVTPTPVDLAPPEPERDILAGHRLPEDPAVIALPSQQAPETPPAVPPSDQPLPPSGQPTLPPTGEPTLPPTGEPTLPPSGQPTPPSSNSPLPPTSQPAVPPSSTPLPPPSTVPSGDAGSDTCAPEALLAGEFLTYATLPGAPADVPPGSTAPVMASPGTVVYVDAPAPGSQPVPCVVPTDFTAETDHPEPENQPSSAAPPG